MQQQNKQKHHFQKMKIKLLLLALFVSAFSWGQIYQHDFGTTAISAHPYNVAPGVLDTNLSGSSWSNSTNAWTSFAGSAGQAITLNNSSGTPTLTLTFNVAIGFQMDVTSFDFWRRRSTTGAQNWSMTINGIAVGAGTVPTTGASIGETTVSNAVSGQTGTVSVVISLSGATGTGTFRLDDFTLNGTVTPVGGCSDPVEQAIDIVVSNPSTTSYTIAWTPAVTAFGTMVVVRPVASALVAPVSGTTYTANAAYGAGSNLGSNNFVVYKGTGSSVNVTGLAVGANYVITIYSYNSPDCYSSTTPESLPRYTLATEPGSQATGVTSCGANTLNSVIINFPSVLTAGITNCSGYLILMREGAAPPAAALEDGVYYNPGAVVGNATVVAYVNGSTATRTVTGLNAGTTYYFILVPFGGNFSTIRENLNYRISGTPLGLNCATSPSQEINVRGVIGSNPTIPDGDTTPQGTDNTLYATVATGAFQDKVFRIENTGNLVLTISGITFTGPAATNFSVQGGLTYPFTIAGGAFFDITVRFAPTVAGVRTAILNIANDDANENPYNFYVQGTGTVTPLVDINVTGNGNTIPDNSIYPSGVNHTAFGVATVGVTTVVRTFTIENLGSSLLSLTGAPLVLITGPHASMFTVTALPSASIAGGGSTSFQVTFNPTSLGAKNATISIESTDPDENPYNFNISGNAKGANNIYVYGNGNDVLKGALTTSVTNFTDFGPVAITTGLRQNTFIITNLAGATRFFSNATVSGPDAAMFTVVSNPTANGLGDGNSTSFTINFTPTSVGIKNATVTFNVYQDSGLSIPEPIDPVFTFAISGLGTNYVTCTNGLVETIMKQDFESPISPPNWTYTKTYASDSADNGVETIGGGTYNNGSGNVNAFATPGSISYQFRGFADAGETSSNSYYQSATLTFASVDTQLFRDINFSMNVGAFRTGSQGLDVNDFVMVESSVDGGTNWSTEAVLRGFSNSRWDFTATGVFNAYYTGTNTGATVDTRVGNAELANGYATFNVKNLPSVPNLQMRVTIYVDRDSEIWAIDNVKLEGKRPVASVWNSPLFPGTWSPTAPTSSTTAIINGNFNTLTNGNFNTCECIINNGFAVTVEGAGSFIEVQNNIQVGLGSTLEVLDDASLVMKNDFGVVTNNGTVRMSRETSPFKRFDYVYWSSPLTNANLATTFAGWRIDRAYEFQTPNFEDLLSINNLGVVTDVVPDTFDDYAPWAWQQYSGIMSPGKGYAIMAPTTGTFPRAETRTFTGVGLGNTFNNGIITIPIELSANDTVTTDDYNLVGNPYPSAIFANDFINANLPNITGTLYFWTHNTAIANTNQANNANNHTTNDYAMYNLIGGIATGATVGTPCANCPSSQIPTGFIASGQGFLVEAENDTSDVVFNNSMRSNAYANDYFYRVNPNAANTNSISGVVLDKIWLNFANNDGFFSQQLIGYTAAATNGYDKGYDGLHNNALNYVNFYSLIGSEMYRIQGRTTFDISDEVPLGYTTAIAGTFTISSPKQEGILEEIPVYLEDKATGYFYDLKMNPFTFETAVGTFNDRFVLRYTNTTLSATDFEAAANDVIAFGSNGMISIHSKKEALVSVTVLDVLGKVVSRKDNVSSNDIQFANPTNANQAFVLKITLANGMTVTKKVVL
jgi:hypothetical protein